MIKGWGKMENREDYIVASPSKLALLRECPELYKYRYIDKLDKPTESMEFGTLCHMAILEPEKFDQIYTLPPQKTFINDLSLNELKQICSELSLKVSGTKKELLARIREVKPIEKQFDEICEEVSASGKQMISNALYDKIKIVKDKVMNHPQLGRFIELGEKEKYGHWQDEKTGVVVAFMTDVVLKIKDVCLIIDFKFTSKWDVRDFERSNFYDGRHLLAAAYCRGVSKIENLDYNNFLFVAIEPTAPHRMRLYQADSAFLEAGFSELDFYLKEFKRRTEENDWKARDGYDLIQPTTLPNFAWEQIKEDI